MSQDLLYKVAYDEAVRALSEQQGIADSFRTRAGHLFSVAAITTSFQVASGLLTLEVALWIVAVAATL